MNPTDYQRLALRTECDNDKARQRLFLSPDIQGDTDSKTSCITATRLSHAVLGILSEGGELASKIRKWIYYGKPLSLPEILDELGDVAWFFALACDCLGIDANEVLSANIRKLRARYPDRFDEGREARENRDREAERRALVDNIMHPRVSTNDPNPPHLTQEELDKRAQQSLLVDPCPPIADCPPVDKDEGT